jgi:hypothetical protein
MVCGVTHWVDPAVEGTPGPGWPDA